MPRVSRRLRSPPIRRRCTRPCWWTYCRRPGTAPTGTPTTRVECDHGRLRASLRPMRGLKQDRSARILIAGHGFVQKSATRPLRGCGRGAGGSALGGCVRRARLGDLIPGLMTRRQHAACRPDATELCFLVRSRGRVTRQHSGLMVGPTGAAPHTGRTPANRSPQCGRPSNRSGSCRIALGPGPTSDAGRR
jgi:hypothetical protein